ncbi:hypothetical protein N7516_008107 [Penicillium verrucosum]|uniref:uncharacterized protein n=1 Tax=Penicillium verrucosum TaxID=60171 RepID=UPI0025458AC1|nr:uncharacterized protein N7516_008107 [Penicillium verrucosum]KAJ5926334.1 hypothetical protein N7516_008107 [Penicillium verrucosum]
MPVFLGTVHGAGEIRHMLIMAWGGENLEKMEMPPDLERQIRRSRKEIYAHGIVHDDMRWPNLSRNVELQTRTQDQIKGPLVICGSYC